MRTFSTDFKLAMVARLTGPNPVSVLELAHETGIGRSTLYRWLERWRTVGTMSKHPQKGPQRAPEEKLRLIMEAAALSGEELGAFLRREGIRESTLEEWKAAATAGLQASSSKKPKSSPEQRELKKLERELNRKDKALAEVTALLALKKKVQEIWGDEDENTPPKSG